MKLQIKDAYGLGKYKIGATDVNGKDWVLKQTFNCDDVRTAPLVKKINEVSQIETDYWTLKKPR